jgi:ADP-heptose:LPS heptosyltransferase
MDGEMPRPDRIMDGNRVPAMAGNGARDHPDRILVRAPNWLGDLVMSAGFFGRLRDAFPGAAVSVIVREELAGLVPLLGAFEAVYPLPRRGSGNPLALVAFGRRTHGRYRLFFTLPDSFASAWLGFWTGSRERIGFRKEGRSFLLTRALAKPSGRHRTEEYVALLGDFLADPADGMRVRLEAVPPRALDRRGHRLAVGLNVHSEAASRRMPLSLWAEIGRRLIAETDSILVLTGAPGERERTQTLARMLARDDRVLDMAGRTAITELPGLLASLDLLISSDSGPAHLANAVGTHTVVLFGAGDERCTAPYNAGHRTVIRVEGFECAPCRSNRCFLGEIPPCLAAMDPRRISDEALRILAAR